MHETAVPKKLMILYILDILSKYTDEQHRLSQREIADILQKEYSMTCDRKSIKRNLTDLMEFGYDIEYTETPRGEDESGIMTDFYLVRDFTDSELRLLIDSVLFSKHIPHSQCRELISKLEGLSNRYFKARVRHICTVVDGAPQNSQLFYTIETLDEAISGNKQVAFTYNDFGLDKRLHPRLDRDGAVREYVINPYQIAAANGRYYLICNYDRYDTVSNYRIDRITEARLLDTPRKPVNSVRGLERGLDLPRHMAEHIYMYTGESADVTFRMEKSLVSEVIDWFGRDISFFDESDTEVTARVRVNLMSMRKWALQYALSVRILSPDTLVNQVRDDIGTAMNKYASVD